MKRAGQPNPGVVDEHVRIGTVRGERRFDLCRRVGHRDIERQHADIAFGLGADKGCGLLQRLEAPRHQHHVAAGRCEPPRQLEADAFRAAGHHRHRPQALECRERRTVGAPPAAAPG
jgi:hypothetical protein